MSAQIIPFPRSRRVAADLTPEACTRRAAMHARVRGASIVICALVRTQADRWLRDGYPPNEVLDLSRFYTTRLLNSTPPKEPA